MTISIAVLALLLGMGTHILKAVWTSRVTPGPAISLRTYLTISWPENLLSVFCSVGMYLSYPELGTWFPALGALVQVPDHATAFGGFWCGYLGDSLASVFGKRIVRVVNG